MKVVTCGFFSHRSSEQMLTVVNLAHEISFSPVGALTETFYYIVSQPLLANWSMSSSGSSLTIDSNNDRARWSCHECSVGFFFWLTFRWFNDDERIVTISIDKTIRVRVFVGCLVRFGNPSRESVYRLSLLKWCWLLHVFVIPIITLCVLPWVLRAVLSLQIWTKRRFWSTFRRFSHS